MPTFRLRLAYDGTDYRGWQIQPGAVTLQGLLEEALARVVGQRVRVVGSGRTDAGVHALGQVASFAAATTLAPAVLLRALNAHLPDDVAVWSVDEVPAGFHARRDARRKRYRYALFDGPVRDVFRRRCHWHVHAQLDERAMHRAAQPLVGRHDFASFQSAGSPRRSTERTVFELSVARQPAGQGGEVHVEIEADGFLYNMVRAIVGTLQQVGRGGEGESWPAQVLAARDRRAAAQTAPPQGLVLLGVTYDI